MPSLLPNRELVRRDAIEDSSSLVQSGAIERRHRARRRACENGFGGRDRPRDRQIWQENPAVDRRVGRRPAVYQVVVFGSGCIANREQCNNQENQRLHLFAIRAMCSNQDSQRLNLFSTSRWTITIFSIEQEKDHCF